MSRIPIHICCYARNTREIRGARSVRKAESALSRTRNLVPRRRAVFATHQKRITTGGPVKEMFDRRQIRGWVCTLTFSRRSARRSRAGSERCALRRLRERPHFVCTSAYMVPARRTPSRDLCAALSNPRPSTTLATRAISSLLSTAMPSRKSPTFVQFNSLLISSCINHYLSSLPPPPRLFALLPRPCFSKESRAVAR